MLSVVITVRNRPKYLRECLEALLKQDYPSMDYEIIVVDDASTDSTTEEAVHYGGSLFVGRKTPPYFVKVLESHSGPGIARNIGNSMAIGDIIVVQDSDDISLRDRLSIIARYFEAHPHVDLFYSGANMVDRNLKNGRYHHARHGHWKRLEQHQDIWHPTMAYRKKILTCGGGIIEYPADMADVDYGFLLAAKAAGVQYGLYDQPLVLYRTHPGQISRAQNVLQQKLAREKSAAAQAGSAGASSAPARQSHYQRRKGK